MSLSGYLLLTTAAGDGLAFQAVINARLSAALGSPLWATVVQVIVGLLMLIVVVGATRQPMPVLAGVSRLPWWIWIGGMLGAAYVLTMIVATQPINNIALMLATVIVGQTLAALAIDHFGWFGLAVHRLSPARVLGVACLLAGVLLIRWR
jgi:transporter family-2 protein